VLAALDQFVHECDHSDPDTFKVRRKIREWNLQLDEIREQSAPPPPPARGLCNQTFPPDLCKQVNSLDTTDGKNDGNSNAAASGESATQQTSGLSTTNEDLTHSSPPGQKRKREFEDEGKSSKQRKVSANTQRYDGFFGKQRGEAAAPSRSQQSDMTGPKRNKKAPNPTAREASVNSSLSGSNARTLAHVDSSVQPQVSQSIGPRERMREMLFAYGGRAGNEPLGWCEDGEEDPGDCTQWK
jgi:hypothetical protein